MFPCLFSTLSAASDEPPPVDASPAPADLSPASNSAAPAKRPVGRPLPAIPLARPPARPEPAAVRAADDKAAGPEVIPLGRAGKGPQPIPLKPTAAPPAAAEPPAAPAVIPVQPAPPPRASAPAQQTPAPAAPIQLRQPAQPPPPAVAAPPAPVQGAAPAPPKAPKQPGPAVPKLGTFEAQKSKYYSHMVVDPVSGAHYDADTGKTTDAGKLSAADIVAQEQATVTARQIAKFAGALVVIVLITARLAAIIPQYYHWWLGVGAFVGCLLMPILGAAPYGEDDSSDVPLGIALYLVLGPVVGAISYAVISALRSAFNPAILGVGFVYVVIRVAMDAFAPDHGIAQLFTSLMPWTMPPGTMSWPSHLVSMYLVFAGLAGWYAAGMFHKLNE